MCHADGLDARLRRAPPPPDLLPAGEGRPMDLCIPHHSAFLGSKASRAASPMKISKLSIVANTANPAMPSQGA
jgi:hypothetical protein